MVVCILKRMRICHSQFCHSGLRMNWSWKYSIIHYDFRAISNCNSNSYMFTISFCTSHSTPTCKRWQIGICMQMTLRNTVMKDRQNFSDQHFLWRWQKQLYNLDEIRKQHFTFSKNNQYNKLKTEQMRHEQEELLLSWAVGSGGMQRVSYTKEAAVGDTFGKPQMTRSRFFCTLMV